MPIPVETLQAALVYREIERQRIANMNKKEITEIDNNVIGTDINNAADFAAELQKCREVMRDIEWEGSEILENGMTRYMLCPVCTKGSNEGHSTECRLAALLPPTSDKPPSPTSPAPCTPGKGGSY